MFITFEGIDGSGKSTQIELLRARLDGEVVVTREPGGTRLGEAVRELVLHGDDMTPWAEAALYASARAQHVEEVIRPALERGATVLCDRYIDSSVAYQGAGRGLGEELIRDLNVAATRGLVPDLTFLFAIDAQAGLERVGDVVDRLEREDLEFHRRVAAAYDRLAAAEPDRIVRLDATAPVETLHQAIVERLQRTGRAA